VNINWKIIAIFGGIGFFISLLTGAISGVGFGTILLRGIISGIIFGGIGFGLTFIIKKFLPEMDAEEKSELEEDVPTVDIVIEEENPPSIGEEFKAPEEDEAGIGLDSDISGSQSFVEEVEETSGEDLEAAELEEAEEVEEADESAELVEIDESEGVDALPDIGEFSGTFSTGPDFSDDSGNEGTEDVQIYSDDNSSIELLGKDEDPAAVAKAVQTMLKRD